MLTSTLILSILSIIHAIPIPNDQVGSAEVECTQESIDIVFSTEKDFEGRIFVIGHSDNPKCVSWERGGRTTFISIPNDQCGVTTMKSIDPPGLIKSVKVMLSFHEQFVTKIDKGYDVVCFYMESDKTVTYPLSVSMNPLIPYSVQAEMPRCRYEVVDPHSKTFKPIEVAQVGTPVLHTWTCESTSPDLWCMTVHSCYVEDEGNGERKELLNDKGCAIDRYLLDNLEYGPGVLHAQKEAHAFKFADNVVTNFQCTVKLDIKDGSDCPMRDVCSDLGLEKKVVKREVTTRGLIIAHPYNNSIEMDVRANTMQIIDSMSSFTPLGDYHLHRPSCYTLDSILLPFIVLLSLLLSLFIALLYMIRNRPLY